MLMLWTLSGCDAVSGASQDATIDASTGALEDPRQHESTLLPKDQRWQDLIMVDWSVPPGTERYVCALVTVPEEVFIQRFEPVASRGTHHVLLTLAAPGGTEGTFDCSPGTLSDALLFASGVASDLASDLASGNQHLPAGVAMHIPAGSQVLINLHLLNPLPTASTGTSGIRVQVVEPVEVAQQAEMVFAGTTRFTLPKASQASATGRCVFDQDATVALVWPHMHTFGIHMRVVHVTGAPDDPTAKRTTLHDGPFEFGHQHQYPISRTLVRAGESLEVTCTWDNTSDQEVGFGDSTLDEMCFAGIVRYPASNTGLYCPETL